MKQLMLVVPSGTTESMGVFGVARDVFVAGGGGTILRYAAK
jgi:hypothetical protein